MTTNLMEEARCEDCNGKGEHFIGVTGYGMGRKENYKTCNSCNGTGYISVLSEARPGEAVKKIVLRALRGLCAEGQR